MTLGVATPAVATVVRSNVIPQNDASASFITMVITLVPYACTSTKNLQLALPPACNTIVSNQCNSVVYKTEMMRKKGG